MVCQFDHIRFLAVMFRTQEYVYDNFEQQKKMFDCFICKIFPILNKKWT